MMSAFSKTSSIISVFLSLSTITLFSAALPDVKPVLSVVTDSLLLTIGPDARTLEFTDKSSGINYADVRTRPSFVCVRRDNKIIHADKAAISEGKLYFDFGDTDIKVTLKLTGSRHSIGVEVISVAGQGVDECIFVHLPLRLKGVADEPFSACALALNLQTKVVRMPRAADFLMACCYPRFGFAGAKVALVGCPQKDLRRMLQDVVTASPDLPHSSIGGPWALDVEINRGSYLFAPVSEKTVDDWIQLAKSIGINQIDFDGMSRYGDSEPFPSLYPSGRAGLKAAVAKVHAAGLKAGLHTYAFFISKGCPWVTPVPDARLGKDATLTLAVGLDDSCRSVVVSEPTAEMSAITGFFVRNSATLQIDDELITYSDVRKEAPFGFNKCKRGAFGTHVAPHAKGAKVHHLKECFGRFTPGCDSTLLAEVAARQAEVVNDCGFDMMYIDALDGEDILAGRENGWHYGSKFVFELWKRFDHPVLLEMSTMHHHLWTVRSRMGAWDHPRRSHKRFIDSHCRVNAIDGRMFLPMHLGWWAFKTWSGPQGEPTFTDDIEYLCCKAIGNDVGISLMGVTPETFAKNSTFQRLGGITRKYDALRHANILTEDVKAKLRVSGADFTLVQDAAGAFQLSPMHCQKHKIARINSADATWEMNNNFKKQPLRLRFEVLMSAEPYNTSSAVTMAGFTNTLEFTDTAHAKAVSATLRPSTFTKSDFSSSVVLCATNSTPTRSATWARFGKTFNPPLNLGGERALGIWVHGDGKGEVLNIQLECPSHVVAGLGEHYIVVDFKGWRYFELIESDGERHADYSWPYGGRYAIYRECIDYTKIEKLTLWVNNLPANGSVSCVLSPVCATSLVKAKISNPSLQVGDHRLVFPVQMESGSYLEFYPPNDCSVFGSDGNLLKQVKISGEVPNLEQGINRLRFECDCASNLNARIRVTNFTVGMPLISSIPSTL